MTGFQSIFLDVVLPNATTWFYLSLALAAALFFRFTWTFSVQNWDLAMLFLAAPALLFLSEAQSERNAAQSQLRFHELHALAQLSAATLQPPAPVAAHAGSYSAMASLARTQHAMERAERNVWRGYLWLLCCAAYFLVRCLIDLGLVRRPAFHANLNLSGLICLGSLILLVLSLKLILPAIDPGAPAAGPPVQFEGMNTVVVRTAEEVQQRVVPQFEMEQAVTVGILGIVLQIIVVAGLVAIGVWHFQRPAAGVAAAVLFLLLPYVTYQGKELTHVFPAALLVAALACHRWPTITALLLATGTASVYFPILLVPLWVSYYAGRGAWRFGVVYLLALLALGVTLWLSDSLGSVLEATLGLPDWRAWDLSAPPTSEGLWTGLDLHYAYRLPFFIAYLALVVAAAFWPNPKNLGHLLALTGALVVGVQFWFGNAGGTYVLWYLPILILLLLRPSLHDVAAPSIDPQRDWLHRLRRRLAAWLPKAKAEPVGVKA